MPDDYRDLTLRVVADGSQLKVLGADFRKAGEEAKGAGKEAEGAAARARKFFSQLPTVAKAAALFAVHQAFRAINRVVGQTYRAAVSYESAFSKIIGLVGVSREQVSLWKQDLKSLAPEVGKGLGETQDIARLVTGAVTTYGREVLSAAEATDILTVAVREGKAEASSYANSLGRVLADAQHLDVTFAEVAGTVASVSLLERSPDQIMTQLLAVLKGLNRPSREASELLASVRHEADGTALSFSAIRREIRERGLLAGIDLLSAAAEELGEEKFARLFESGEAFSLILALTGKNAVKTREILGATADSAGATDRAFAEAAKTTEFWQKVLSARLQVAMVNLGSLALPLVRGGIKALATLVGLLTDAFTGLYNAVERVFAAIPKTLSKLDRLLRRLPRNAGRWRRSPRRIPRDPAPRFSSCRRNSRATRSSGTPCQQISDSRAIPPNSW